MKKFDFENYQEKVSTAIELSAADFGSLSLSLRKITDQAEQHLVESGEGDFGLIACRAGCASCCVVNVSILFPEGLAIAGYVQTLPLEQQSEIIERLDILWRAVRGLTDDERIYLRQSCAFLDDSGSCRIYTVRPLLCRSVTSTSAKSCRQALTANLFGESSPVLMNLFQQQLFESLYLGIGAGLENAGLEGRSAELTGLVRYLLQTPAAKAALFSGKRLDWHELA
ncbi:MAG TPA: YkgJ family cysteine cluster protein [Geopsychrobacteraceae bacterium]|nr:YkgJ family cysteine cluster protein [Geopsychrobacteraceae bacterium]